MKTDELINMLANHAPPVDRQIVTRRFGTALVIGLALALLVLLMVFGIRPDIGQVAATLAYSLHCPEMSVAFWAVWYVLGMLIPTAVGALLGPRLLRW